MATENITPKNTLKSWFKRGLKPLEAQFHSWLDSYWHKSELIPTATIDGLETILNNKAESVEIKGIYDDMLKHEMKETLHKTEHEQEKLDNLASNPNLTYATKEDVLRLEPVELKATGVSDSLGRIKYTLDENSKDIIKNALLNGESLIGAILNGSYVDTSSYVREVKFTCTYSVIIDSRILELRFSRTGQDMAYSMYFKAQMINGHISGPVMGGTESFVEYGKYLPEKYYIDEPGSYDMNKFKLSGGILLATSDTIIVDNLPSGFTSVMGYCLSNMMGCTQVITDTYLDQTAMRTYGFVDQADGTSVMAWSAWKRIDYKPEEATVVLTGTYTTSESGKNAYVMDDSSKERIKLYVKNNEVKPIIVHFRGGDSGLPYLEWTCEHVQILGDANRRFLFSSISSESGGVVFHRIYFDVRANLGSTNVTTPFEYKKLIFSSEYLHNRYEPTTSWDINDFTESGGISAYIYEDVTGLNMPEGFTDFYGYVLSNYQPNSRIRCCTQVVTDMILQKTMIRSSVPSEDHRSTVWLPWKEVGAKQEVYVVAEYPTDLTGYQDGSIFIKQ